MPRSLRTALLAAPVLASLSGCNPTAPDAFPESLGFQPIEPCTAPPPQAGLAGDPYPETASYVTGWAPDSSYSWAHGYAYVKASLPDTWAAMQDPAVCALNKVDNWRVDLDVEPQFPVSFRIHYWVNTIITVEWELTWRQGALDGTVAQPVTVGARYQKTWGTTHLHLESGSVVLDEVVPGITRVQMVGHLSADQQGGPADVNGTLAYFYEKLVLKVHGQTLPYP
jgi:hypothetical protein